MTIIKPLLTHPEPDFLAFQRCMLAQIAAAFGGRRGTKSAVPRLQPSADRSN